MAITLKERFGDGRGVGTIGTLIRPLKVNVDLDQETSQSFVLRLGYDAVPASQFLSFVLPHRAMVRGIRVSPQNDPRIVDVAVSVSEPDNYQITQPLIQTANGIGAWKELPRGRYWICVAMMRPLQIIAEIQLEMKPVAVKGQAYVPLPMILGNSLSYQSPAAAVRHHDARREQLLIPTNPAATPTQPRHQAIVKPLLSRNQVLIQPIIRHRGAISALVPPSSFNSAARPVVPYALNPPYIAVDRTTLLAPNKPINSIAETQPAYPATTMSSVADLAAAGLIPRSIDTDLWAPWIGGSYSLPGTGAQVAWLRDRRGHVHVFSPWPIFALPLHHPLDDTTGASGNGEIEVNLAGHTATRSLDPAQARLATALGDFTGEPSAGVVPFQIRWRGTVMTEGTWEPFPVY